MSEQSRSEHENVVRLNPERNKAQSGIVLTRLPAAMHALRDKARQQLQALLAELFERADDALFELADKATNNHEQNLYFDSMREVRLKRRGMETAFFRQLDIGFAQLLDHNAYRDKPVQDEVSLDDLSLVKNDELEELVAVDAMVNKANEQYAELIQHLTMRIDHLVPIKVYQKNNPLGADAICKAFSEAAQDVRIDLKAKLVLFKLFDNLVVAKLGNLYKVLNQLLIDANILPSLKSSRPKGRSSDTASNRPVEEHYGMGASAEYQGASSGAGSQNSQAEVLHVLRDLLGQSSLAQGSHYRSPGKAEIPAQAEMIESQDLVGLLSRVQQRDLSRPAQAQSVADVRELLQDLLRDREQHAINQVDEDVINLVSMMFEFILDDRNLAAPMKALLGRLQIPMIKVAVADKSFFAKGGHPARRLLNEMAMAALGWQEDSEENKRKDNLYSQIENIVKTILSDFETDMGIFASLLTDFRAYQEKETRRAQILEQRTLDAEDGKAKSERARAEVDKVLTTLTAGKALPDAADRLLREAWANVMYIICLKEGVESDTWQQACGTAEQLIWSATAPMDKDNRQRLLKTVPVLLQSLREGLEGIAFNPFNMTQLFKQLEAVHLSRLRGEAAQVAPKIQVRSEPPSPKQPLSKPPLSKTVTAPAADPEKLVTPPVTAARVEGAQEKPVSSAVSAKVEVVNPVPAQVNPAGTDGAAVTGTTVTAETEKVVEPAVQLEPGDPHLALVGNLTQGSWFEMQADDQKYRCRLAAIIKPTGKYIFVNRTGMKVAEETREELALALKTGRLRVLDDGMLFDRALEAVIGNLRNSRAGA